MKYMKILLLAVVSTSVMAVPLTTEFTFQGELIDSGSPANGDFDVNFRLYDTAAGGSEVGTVVFVDDLTVSNGLIQTDIDFGDVPFMGEAVWVQVEIRPGTSVGAFEVLSPRQKVTLTPYSIQSMFVADGGVTSSSIANDAVGTAEIDSSEVQQRVSGTCPVGSAMRVINESGTVTCQAADDNDWSIVGNFTSSNTPFVGINTTSSIGSGSFMVKSPFSDTFGGMFVDVDGTGFEQPFYGYATNGSFRAWSEFNENADQIRFNINNSYKLALDSNGRLGVNETNPQRNLHVDGNARIEDLGFVGSGRAQVLVEPDGDLVTGPTTHTIAVPPAAFTVEEPGDSFQKVLGNGHAFILSGFGALSAPVYLPDGAVVTRVDVWYLDNSVQDLTLRLRRSSHTSISNSDLAAILPSGSVAGIRTAADTSISVPTIDNDAFSYYFRVFSSNWTGVNMGIRAVKITYRL